MLRYLIAVLFLFGSTTVMSQALPVSKVVNKLLFNLDVHQNPDSLVADLKMVKQLHLITKDKEHESKYIFTFSESPIAGLSIGSGSGSVEIDFAKSSSHSKTVALTWNIYFQKESDKNNYFNRIRDLFDPSITIMKFIVDQDKHSGIRFTDITAKDGIKEISFFWAHAPEKESYRLFFMLK